MTRRAAILCWALFAAGFTRAASTPPEPRPIAVMLEDASQATRRIAGEGIRGLGGRVLHEFDDMLVVLLPPGRELSAYHLRGVRELDLNAGTATGRRAAESSPSRAAWNAIATGWNVEDRGSPPPAAELGDALMPPATTLQAVRAARLGAQTLKRDRIAGLLYGEVTTTSGPLGATDSSTSEFLAGAVSINLILVESDGSIESSSENWSAAREADVVAHIATGLEWVRTREPQAAIRFVYHVFAGRTDPRARTGFEPIRRKADPSGVTGEDLWVRDVLARFGYTSGDRFVRSRAFAADTRAADRTDWAVNIFVVDSWADTDGKFADGRFAYTWIGGPHLVMTYDNGAWGSARMDMVIRHELLHAFYAFDEYTGSACTCTEHRGYLDGTNVNCETCNQVAGACVMISNGDALCPATRRQVGWADLDGDGVIDVVGQQPDTFLDAMPSLVCGVPVLSGLASVVAATDRNTYMGISHPSISVNRVANVEVRTDGGPWAVAHGEGSSDGLTSLPQVRFSVAFPSLAPGPHRLEARAIDDHGNTDPDPGGVDVEVRESVAVFGDSVRAGRSGEAGVKMTWNACPGAASYRVYRRPSPGGAETLAMETAVNSWTDRGATAGYYAVRPVDACGRESAD